MSKLFVISLLLLLFAKPLQQQSIAGKNTAKTISGYKITVKLTKLEVRKDGDSNDNGEIYWNIYVSFLNRSPITFSSRSRNSAMSVSSGNTYYLNDSYSFNAGFEEKFWVGGWMKEADSGFNGSDDNFGSKHVDFVTPKDSRDYLPNVDLLWFNEGGGSVYVEFEITWEPINKPDVSTMKNGILLWPSGFRIKDAHYMQLGGSYGQTGEDGSFFYTVANGRSGIEDGITLTLRSDYINFYEIGGQSVSAFLHFGESNWRNRVSVRFNGSGYTDNQLSFIWRHVQKGVAYYEKQRDVPKMTAVGLRGWRDRSRPYLYNTESNRINFDIGFNPSDPNGVLAGILLHEYGHKVMQNLVGKYAYKSRGCLNHLFDREIDEQCAFIEGWATFYSLCVNNKNVYKYALQNVDFGNRREKSLSEEGTIVTKLLKMKNAGLPVSEMLLAMDNMSASNLTYSEFYRLLGNKIGRRYLNAYGLGDPGGHSELKKRNIQSSELQIRNSTNALGNFEHKGAWFVNGTRLYDDTSLREYGSIDDCARRCLNDPKCIGFTFAYDKMGDRGQYCSTFNYISSMQPANVDYQYYKKIQ